MDISISRPELLNIADEETANVSFGGNQAWYTQERRRRAGCGPTCAANILAYLAFTNPALRGLYSFESMTLASFAQYMEEIYEFVTPGNKGLNRTEMFTEGISSFARSRGFSLTPHVFEVASNMLRSRASADELTEFVKAGLDSDCPLGFLNLTKGRVKNLQSWHWITITAAQIGERSLIADASDEGQHRRFDLRLWYLSTRLPGGLVYFTYEKS